VIVLSIFIRPTNILQHAAAWLFQRTGQSIGKQSQQIQKSLLEHFSGMSFHPSIRWISTANADILLIEAYKSIFPTKVME
jgi:hypothetical protein